MFSSTGSGSHRIARFADDLPMPGKADDLTSAAVMDQIRGLYFDVALGANTHALAALLALADPTRILFGSDYPFAPETVMQDSRLPGRPRERR